MKKDKANKQNYPPDSKCILCQCTLEEVGGKRIVAQYPKGITRSKIWGFDEEIKKRALKIFKEGKHPWFCQKCADLSCSICGSPIQTPCGSDVLYDDGSTWHIAILPIGHGGCINPECPHHRKVEK